MEKDNSTNKISEISNSEGEESGKGQSEKETFELMIILKSKHLEKDTTEKGNSVEQKRFCK